MPAYLREIFYFVPMALALQLQKSGQYLAALDWFRVVYACDLPVKAAQDLLRTGRWSTPPCPIRNRCTNVRCSG